MSDSIVTKLPLDALPAPWEDIVRQRELLQSDVQEMLKCGRVRFVIASLGHPLRWVDDQDCYTFWKNEVRDRLADPNGDVLERFPGEYCFFASEWSDGGRPIILLSVAH